ncbi:uncharacterized protein B0I36DRAFT_245052, partial [Microdochium trichocladiopsis]
AHDPVLTALAQLGVIRLDARRCLVSVFDRRRQLVIATATKSSSLLDNTKSHGQTSGGTTAIPRSLGVCEHVLFAEASDQGRDDLPVSLVPDLSQDPRFCNCPHVIHSPTNRFYAGVPLVTLDGIRYGVLCVMDDRPRSVLSDEQLLFFQELSRTVSRHLESRRLTTACTRGERMVHGLGSFFEDKIAIAPRQSDSTPVPLQSPPSAHAPVSTGLGANMAHTPYGIDPTVSNTPSASSASTRTIRTLSSLQDPISRDSKAIFGRAASIIRESAELEGVVFLDACISSFGGLVLDEDGACHSPSLERQGDALAESWGEHGKRSPKTCHILGYSTIAHTSTNQDCASVNITMSEKALQSLLKRYPSGKVFIFDEDGFSLDDMDDEDAQGDIANNRDEDLASQLPFTPGTSTLSFDTLPNLSSQKRDSEFIASVFPGARSVCLVPLWDARKEKWFAGSFMWTSNPARCLTLGGEMSYLRAFATTIMAEVDRLYTCVSERAKSDLLGSLSHELRSPLHGIVTAIELLQDTELNAFQGGLLQTMDYCGHTLLDVIDHLLDYSKINTLVKSNHGAASHTSTEGSSRDTLDLFHTLESFSPAIELDVLVEETVESVLSGLQSHGAIESSMGPNRYSSAPRRYSPHRSNSVGSSESTLTWASESLTESVGPSAVSVFVECDPQAAWQCQVEAGAVRRLIMNLLGNALKFTDNGFVKVSIWQEQRQRSNQAYANHLLLNVTDSGKGIHPEFLRHQAFRPFSQEDSLSQGTGLGLSLVKEIVRALHGSLHMESQVHQGTSVTVAIPLTGFTPLARSLTPFEKHVVALKGLRVSLLGFKTEPAAPGIASEKPPTELGIITAICRDWLHLEIVPSDAGDLRPDAILCTGLAARSFMVKARESLPPIVAICSSAVAAHACFLQFSEGDQTGVLEAISHPIGSRKLAKALVMALGRFNNAKGSELIRPPPPLSPPPPAASTRGKSCPASPGAQILLVDDNNINLQILVSFMKKLGHRYQTATNGLEALEAYSTVPCPFSHVLMDISMPVMDGLESTRRIRQFEATTRRGPSKIIALTGLASVAVQKEAYASGVDMYMTKPVRFKELAQLLPK